MHSSLHRRARRRLATAGALALALGVDRPRRLVLELPVPDLALAAKYLRRAGFRSGRYEGEEKIAMVGVAGGASQREAEVAQAQFEKLGFEVDLRLFSGETMMTKFCGLPAAKV